MNRTSGAPLEFTGLTVAPRAKAQVLGGGGAVRWRTEATVDRFSGSL